MINTSFSQQKRIMQLKKKSSEERINEMIKNLEKSGVDNDILCAEISERTGIGFDDVELVLLYECEILVKGATVLDFNGLAKEIGEITIAPDEELKGIEKIDEKTAFSILECEDNIFWEIGINEEVGDE